MIQYKATQNTIFGHTQTFMYYWWGVQTAHTHKMRRIKVFIGLTIEVPFFSDPNINFPKLLYSFIATSKSVFTYSEIFFVIFKQPKQEKTTHKAKANKEKIRDNDQIDEHEAHFKLKLYGWRGMRKKIDKLEKKWNCSKNSAIRNKKYKWTVFPLPYFHSLKNCQQNHAKAFNKTSIIHWAAHKSFRIDCWRTSISFWI